jgi:hypothetical protein
MHRTTILGALVLMTSACNAAPPEAADEAQSESTIAAPSPPAPPAPPAEAPSGRIEKLETDLYEFEYAYPAKAAAIPGLKALLDEDVAKSRAELQASSKEEQAEAAKNGYPYRPHASSAKWQVVADLARWLSLSAELYEYSGGAHGMTFFGTRLWDREANVARAPADLFTSKAALSRVLREPFCAALDKEREKRRGEPVNRESGDQFDECIDPVEHTLILGSSNGRTFDRIGVLVEPYAAGAYAEGTFDITLPVTQAVLGAVKPPFRSAFSVK